MKIKKNDSVLVIAGKDKGKTGKITRVLTKENKIIVEGTNLYKRHLKKRSDKQPGGIVAIERPLAVSMVALKCPSCKQPTRIAYHVLTNSEKIRICKKCQGQVDTKSKK